MFLRIKLEDKTAISIEEVSVDLAGQLAKTIEAKYILKVPSS